MVVSLPLAQPSLARRLLYLQIVPPPYGLVTWQSEVLTDYLDVSRAHALGYDRHDKGRGLDLDPGT